MLYLPYSSTRVVTGPLASPWVAVREEGEAGCHGGRRGGARGRRVTLPPFPAVQLLRMPVTVWSGLGRGSSAAAGRAV